MSAGSRVFDVPELAEMIFLELSTRDILFAKNLTRTTQNVITGSRKLRRALWLTIENPGHKPLGFLPKLQICADNLSKSTLIPISF